LDVDTNTSPADKFATLTANFSKLWHDGAIWKPDMYSAFKKLWKM